MTFKMECEIRKHRNTFIACNYDIVLFNVLLANDDIELDKEGNHEFKLVVNKKGSLTLLCIK